MNRLISLVSRHSCSQFSIRPLATQKPFDIKRHLDFSKVPKLNNRDITEQVGRGSGPGGQSVNTSNNAVTLFHGPTGAVVKCHQTRSLEKNRQIAFSKLITAVDNIVNGEESIESQKKRIEAYRRQRTKDSRKRQREKKLAEKLEKEEEKGTQEDGPLDK